MMIRDSGLLVWGQACTHYTVQSTRKCIRRL